MCMCMHIRKANGKHGRCVLRCVLYYSVRPGGGHSQESQVKPYSLASCSRQAATEAKAGGKPGPLAALSLVNVRITDISP